MDILSLAPWRIEVSTLAPFDLEEEHAVFARDGVEAYAALKFARERAVIERGCGFEVGEKIAQAEPSACATARRSRAAAPELAQPVLTGIPFDREVRPRHRGWKLHERRSIGPFIPAWQIDLFLSKEASDVQAAAAPGAAAAKLSAAPQGYRDARQD